ncbi:response regulator [Opitutus terrae]|uniref:Response regulator receiver protein n=1 Tax=Opitutus terrae (strain DSM 11246 / JCM 15787 / PB90-1) TaxID=452637 RepID=B1ZWK6_OPITP|nr:response regulator [Opitutus terrae]ACB73330.1 response regulator receiver protein [Opitutus terrae PB90-1]
MLPLDPILLVEDEPDAVTLLQHAFARAGISHPVHTVHDGDQAIAYLDGRSAFADRSAYPLPSVVLLDLKLPRCSGLEVLAWIRGDPRFATLPVVVLTSSKERSDLRRAYAAGANSYLVKPSSLTQLVELASAFRAFWLEHNEAPPRHAA